MADPDGAPPGLRTKRVPPVDRARREWGGCRGPAPTGCLPHSRLRSSGRCPHRPPVPPQRHDCPQLGGMTARSGGCCGGVARQGGGHRAPCAPHAYG
ncbi:hypothetical protein EF911_34025 [Streptomyces sp. WAC06128]|nr:hypothetical protein EF911_34025 [Streptomyces sp. WAC06128]